MAISTDFSSKNSQRRIAVISTGTELTSGQITNRNASWISSRLTEMGIPTVGHWTVPDDRELIRRALDWSAGLSDLIFVTGGLGPTTDDFTREVIADWASRSLIWDETSWEHLRHRLESRGLPAREIQRQQCYFPESSTILTNPQGTANGFRLEVSGKTLIVLPGPPREIEAIWNETLHLWLQSELASQDPWITRSWDTLGLGESGIAEIAEAALAGCDFEKGYRAHLPYVEVKMSFLKSRQAEAGPWIDKVTTALASHTVLRDGEEATQKLAQSLLPWQSATQTSTDRNRIFISDQISGSYLWSRLGAVAAPLWRDQAMMWTNTAPEALAGRASDLVLGLEPAGPGRAKATVSHQGQSWTAEWASPYESPQLRDRSQQYFAEKALLFWAETLTLLGSAS